MTARKRPEDKLKAGRKSTYTPEMGERICSLVSTHTIGLKRITQLYDDLPHESAIREWRVMFPEFGARYAQAKLFQAELLAEECLDIADDSRNDWMESLDEEERGVNYRSNAEHINRSRLRIDTRKFLASKLLPKKYGDFRDAETINPQMDEDIKKRYREMDERNRKEY